jgi:hypothetical protein
MTDPDLNKGLLENQFLIKLRTELVIDEHDYEALCVGLVEVARQWKDSTLVDKELAQLIYILAPVCHNMADSFPQHSCPHRKEWSSKVRDYAIHLNALALECLC